jgi:hypothetical protein
MPIDWGGSDIRLADAYGRLGETVRERLLAVAEQYAPQIEADGKRDAPWTDRTANARQGLFTRAFEDDSSVVISFGHRVFYGLFLEVRNAGKYSVILPTLERFYPRIMEALRGLLG